jgi:hypothetical protein
MAQLVVSGATLQCSMAVPPPGPAPFSVLPDKMVTAGGMPAANIMDNKPFVNIPPFALCQAKANPTVIAATAAAMGTPTPAACLPVIPAPWTPGSSTVQIKSLPALNSTSSCMCAYGGQIKVILAGQMTVTVP